MTAVGYRLRTALRTRWRAWAALAALAGLIGGVAIGCLAGARRTETAYRRFLVGTRAADVLVTNGTQGNVNRQFRYEDLRRLPEVVAIARIAYYFPLGTPSRPIHPEDLSPFGPVDGRFGRSVNGARLLHGRLPRGQYELAVTPLAIERLGVHAGDTISLQLGGLGGPPPPLRRFSVVGEIAMQTGLPPLTGGIPPPALLSEAYVRAHPSYAGAFAVRLRHGRRDVVRFQADLERLGGGSQIVAAYETEFTSVIQRSLAVDATALRLVAALFAVVALLLFGQAVRRQSLTDADDAPRLAALGVTPGEAARFSVAWIALVAVTAAVVAAVVAVALSPLTPVGTARQAELHPGLSVNIAYVGLGAAAVLVAVLVVGALPVLVLSRRDVSPAADAGGVPATLPASAGLPPAAALGLRLGVPGRGRSYAAVRSTTVSVALAVATIAGVGCFTASLGHLFHRPLLYGWSWDAQLGDPFAPDLHGAAQRLAGDPDVAALATGTVNRLQIGPLRVDTLGIAPGHGVVRPVVVAGRAPAGPDEIVLGSRTLRLLHARVGDTVPVGFGDRTRRFRVVGRGVFPEFAGAARLGEGAATTYAGMRSVVPSSVENVVLVRVRPGVDVRAVVSRSGALAGANVYLPSKPSDLRDLDRFGGMPSVAAVALALAAAATLAHALLLAVRGRRRDFGVLKTLGFVRRDLATTIAWQASAVALIATAVGLPLGVVAGRTAWSAFAAQLGVPVQPVVPAVLILALIPAALVLANLVAVVPGRFAARTAVAEVLRAE